jgi:hypothetical protein
MWPRPDHAFAPGSSAATMRYLFQDSAVRRKESPPANRIRVTSETGALIEAAVPDGSARSPCDAFPDVACFLTPILSARSDAGRSRRFISPPFPTGIAASRLPGFSAAV